MRGEYCYLTITAVRHTAKLNTDLLENILTMMRAFVTWNLLVSGV